jgi:predicted regulator of Ras-like GTPase activity (Roadblock/LC7/MglB family)
MNNFLEIDERIAKCEQILDADSRSQIFAALADAYRKKGEIEKARKVCSEGLEKHPNYSSARVVMAKIYINERKFDLAEEELQKAISAGGRTRAIDLLEAEILLYRGEHKRARAIVEKIQISDPRNSTIRGLMNLIDNGNDINNINELDMPEDFSPQIPEREFKISDLVNIVKILPRVYGAAVVDQSGFVLEGRFESPYTNDEVSAIARSIFNSVCNNCEMIRLGLVNELLIECGNSKIWIFNKVSFLLIVITRDDVSMGSLKLKIDELLQRLNLSVEESNRR